MTTLTNLVDGAKFRADLESSDRVSDQQWGVLANEAIVRAWTLAAGARPDFQVKSQDFTVASAVSASINTGSIADFFGLIDVVANPDTANEYSLGPFAWANRKSPGAWGPPIFQGQGAQRARLMGSLIYLEPATSAGGTYRVWYTPKPTTLVPPDFTVRATQIGALPGVTSSTGAGVGHTITSLSPGTPFLPDGVPLSVGDRVLLKNSSADNGIYVMTALDPFAMVRATDFDEPREIVVGKTIFVTEGATLAQTYWTVSAFTVGLDAGSGGPVITVASPTPSSTLDPVLDPFIDLLKVSMAITAVQRDERPPNDWVEDRTRMESELVSYFRLIRDNSGPAKTIDTDARGPAYWNAW